VYPLISVLFDSLCYYWFRELLQKRHAYRDLGWWFMWYKLPRYAERFVEIVECDLVKR
jgi:hypothetical protein